MHKYLGIKRRVAIKSILEDVLVSAKMTDANFNGGGYKSNDLPTREEEVTEFIKRRIRLYMDTWVVSRIEKAIDELTI